MLSVWLGSRSLRAHPAKILASIIDEGFSNLVAVGSRLWLVVAGVLDKFLVRDTALASTTCVKAARRPSQRGCTTAPFGASSSSNLGYHSVGIHCCARRLCTLQPSSSTTSRLALCALAYRTHRLFWALLMLTAVEALTQWRAHPLVL